LEPPKILILILSSEQEPWKSVEALGQNQTFLKGIPGNVEVVRFIGGIPQAATPFSLRLARKAISFQQLLAGFFQERGNKKLGRLVHSLALGSAVIRRFQAGSIGSPEHDQSQNVSVLRVRSPEGYAFLGLKTLEAFKWAIVSKEFDYVFRTNSSSYVDFLELSALLHSKPRSKFYSGVIGSYMGYEFASGAGVLLSRDLVMHLVENESAWRHEFVDDVALAIALNGWVSPVSAERVTIDPAEGVGGVARRDIENAFHVRCKAGNKEATIRIMHEVHAIKSR
jgi:hypothetical protein